MCIYNNSPKRGEARKRAYKMVEIPRRFNILAAAFDVEAARARPPCDSSSGSDHFPDETADLWDLVESFMDSEVKALPEDIPVEDKDDKSDVDDDYEDVKERLREICENLGGGGERQRIIEEVVNASEIVGQKRLLMAYLRDKGFDAGTNTNAVFTRKFTFCMYLVLRGIGQGFNLVNKLYFCWWFILLSILIKTYKGNGWFRGIITKNDRELSCSCDWIMILSRK